MNSNKKNIVITSAVRTAIGTFKGSLKNMLGHDLGSVVVKNAIKKSGLDPKYLEIEITESVMMKNEKKSMDRLNKIKDLGVFLSIDDFGTGYSSFNYLNEMPIDTIKIDKSFVSGIDKEKEKYKIANTIINMGNELNISVIAEGVETKDEFKALESAKCSKYQGYYFSKPLTSNQFKKI